MGSAEQCRSQPKNLGGAKKFGGGQNVWFETNNTILFGKPSLKAQNDYFLKIWGAMAPLPPPATTMLRNPSIPQNM